MKRTRYTENNQPNSPLKKANSSITTIEDVVKDFRPILSQWHPFMVSCLDFRLNAKANSTYQNNFIKLDTEREQICERVNAFDEKYIDGFAVIESFLQDPRNRVNSKFHTTVEQIKNTLKQVNEFEIYSQLRLDANMLSLALERLKSTYKNGKGFIERFNYIQKTIPPILNTIKQDPSLRNLRLIQGSLKNISSGLNKLTLKVRVEKLSIDKVALAVSHADSSSYTNYISQQLTYRSDYLADMLETMSLQQTSLRDVIEKLEKLINQASATEEKNESTTEEDALSF